MSQSPAKDGYTFLFDFASAPGLNAPARFQLAITEIDRNNPLPLYHQLYQILLKRIGDREWPPNEALPTEKELGERYDVSRATVRSALQKLVSDGYLYRRQGTGTFVAQPKVRHGPQRSAGLTGYLRARGLEPGWKLLGMERVLPGRRVATGLQIGEDQEVLDIHRLRLADEEVIGVHHCYVIYPLAAKIEPEYMTEGDNSLSYLTEHLNVSFSESHRIIEAVQPDRELIDLLQLSADNVCPLLVIHRVTIATDGTPVEYLHASYRGDRFEYYVHMEH